MIGSLRAKKRTMKPRDETVRKATRADGRLPKGVVQKAANRVGLTRAAIQSTAALLMAGLLSGRESDFHFES
jgi:hypothetical protein